jgi:hypothetical protein
VKEPAPYKCDYCEQRKGATNHWWMLRRALQASASEDFVLIRWSESSADVELSDGSPMYRHICSESCASKALSQHMAKVGAQKPAEALRIEAAAGAGSGDFKK